MAKQASKRAFKYSDGHFTKVVDFMVQTAREDIADLAPLGITEAWLADLKARNEAFAHSLSDRYLVGSRMISTKALSDSRRAVLQQSEYIVKIATQFFGATSSQAVMFMRGSISRMPHNELLRAARGIAKAAESFAAELDSQGISPAYVASYRSLLATYDTQISDQRSDGTERTAGAIDRIAMGNEVYALLLVLANKGRLCYKGINQALYKQYIIYPSKKKKVSK